MAGLLETIKLVAVLIFAIPAALAGLELALVDGRPLVGGALVALAIGLVLIKNYLPLPTDVPGLVLEAVRGSDTRDGEER